MLNLDHAEKGQRAAPRPLDNGNPFVSPQSSKDSSIMGGKMKHSGTNSRRSTKSFRRFMGNELDDRWMGMVIVICFFTSGLVDSVAFNSWSCFVGMQTGNTIFAALGLTGQPAATHRQQYYKSLVSIGSFCLGTLFFNLLHRYPNLDVQPKTRRRSVFLLSFAVQTLLIVAAAVLVTLGLVSSRPAVAGTFSSGSHIEAAVNTSTNYADLAPIALLAFEAAGQVCLSRVFSLVELPTIVLSTLYHDFMANLYGLTTAWRRSESIKAFLFVQQKRQAKRFGSIIALFLGGIVGGEMFKSPAGMAGALWMAAGLKLGICAAWNLWKSEVSDEHKSLP